jgi:uncharacterized protein YndB with AHSA1/START domain
MNESERVLIEVTLPASIDAVWHAVRDHDEIRRWFGWQYDGLDDEIRMIFDGAVEEVSEAGRALSWEVTGHRFEFEPDGQQTVLRVTRAASADGASWDEVYDDINEGWTSFVQQLRFALARHAGEDRRTVWLGGSAVDVDAFPVEAALGLTDVAALTAGSPYDTTIATGDMTGEVWFHAPHQFGVTVEQFGDGLLVVGNQPASARPPHGGGWVIITTYGLDDAAFDGLSQRWTSWWDTRYKPGGDTG